MFEKVYEIKLSHKSFCLEKFFWIGKRYFGQRCRTFLPPLGNILFLEIGNFLWKHIFRKKTFSKTFVRQVWRIFDHMLKLFVNSEAFSLKFEENVGKYQFLKMVLEGFFPKSTKYSLKSQKKITFSSRKFFLKTSSGHINCILTDLGEKNSEKVHTSFSHVRRNLLKTLFLKNQKALKWLFQHVKLTFVIPADSFLPNVQDFCSKSKKTNENKNSPNKLLPQKFVLTRNMQFWQHCQIYSAKHPQQLQRKFSNFWLLLFFPNELFPGNMFSCT